MKIDGRIISPDQPPYVIAELSANHNGDIGQAFAIVTGLSDHTLDNTTARE